MSSSKRVVETVPQISISSVKECVSHQHPIVQLSLTNNYGKQLPYLVKTTRTKCHFGGNRSWFRCIQCDNRAGTLYLSETGTHLFCRTCSNLRYRSQVTGGSGRLLMRCFNADERAEAVFDGLQRVKLLYKGQPTRRFKRYLSHRLKAELLSRLFV